MANFHNTGDESLNLSVKWFLVLATTGFMTSIVLILDIIFELNEQQAGPAGAGCGGGRSPGHRGD
jgi:hypothetical protein